MRYKQTENFRITGPGLPEQGAVAVGPAELEAAFEAGFAIGDKSYRRMVTAYNVAIRARPRGHRRFKREDISDFIIFWAIACREWIEDAKTPEIMLSDLYHPKLVLSKMAHMADRDLIEYGVSLRMAWIVNPAPSQSQQTAIKRS